MTARPPAPPQPFLATIAQPTRPLGDALPSLPTAPVVSPWLPRAEATNGPAGPDPAELAAQAAARDAAIADGRAAGLAETAALREQLARLCNALDAAIAGVAGPTAELVGELATCVVESWVGHTHRSALFAPVVASWLAQPGDPAAVARVHPDDEAAIIAAIDDAPIRVVADPAAAPGSLAISGGARELNHAWPDRLPELRTAIVAALTEVES